MKKNRKSRIIVIVVLAITLVCGGLYVYASQFGHLSLNLPVKQDAVFTADNISDYPGLLKVNQNRILDSAGQAVILRGVMPPDPEVLREKGKFNRNFFADIQATQANVIRIPVHPANWVQDPDYLWRYLAPIVKWAGELNLYVIIDWHYIGNVATGAGAQMPDIEADPKELTLEFWQLMATYFRDTPNVIFEIFNEPESITADEWRSNAIEIIDLIRKQGAQPDHYRGRAGFRQRPWLGTGESHQRREYRLRFTYLPGAFQQYVAGFIWRCRRKIPGADHRMGFYG